MNIEHIEVIREALEEWAESIGTQNNIYIIDDADEKLVAIDAALKWLQALQEGTKEIPLSKGKVALVDAVDYDLLMQWKWHAYLNNGHWYAVRTVQKGERRGGLPMHRIIMDAPQDKMVDHINGDGLDNRRANLRLCTNAENRRNSKTQTNNTSGYCGVSWHEARHKWQAYIKVDGKQKHLGIFGTAIEAAHCYDKAARVLHGEFARLNFPQEVTNE